MAAVVQIGGGNTFDSGERDRVGQQAGALHADSDHAEAQAIAGRYGGFERAGNVFGFNEDIAGDGERSSGAC